MTSLPHLLLSLGTVYFLLPSHLVRAQMSADRGDDVRIETCPRVAVFQLSQPKPPARTFSHFLRSN